MQIRKTDNILIAGQRGSGKTTLAKELIRRFDRVVIWDYLHEYSELGTVTYSLNDVNQKVLDHFKHIVFQPLQENTSFIFEDFCRRAFVMNNFILVVEEVAEVAPTHYMPPSLSRIMRLGRHQGIGSICVTQRIAEVSTKVTGAAVHIFALRTMLPRDISYLKRYIGDVAEELDELEDFQAIVRTRNKTIRYDIARPGGKKGGGEPVSEVKPVPLSGVEPPKTAPISEPMPPFDTT